MLHLQVNKTRARQVLRTVTEQIVSDQSGGLLLWNDDIVEQRKGNLCCLHGLVQGLLYDPAVHPSLKIGEIWI